MLARERVSRADSSWDSVVVVAVVAVVVANAERAASAGTPFSSGWIQMARTMNEEPPLTIHTNRGRRTGTKRISSGKCFRMPRCRWWWWWWW